MEFKEVSNQCLAGIYQEIAEQIGIEDTWKLYEYFKGQQLSLPLKFYNNEYIARQIHREYGGGKKIRDIAREYGYTERRIRQIVRNENKKEETQLDKKIQVNSNKVINVGKRA